MQSLPTRNSLPQHVMSAPSMSLSSTLLVKFVKQTSLLKTTKQSALFVQQNNHRNKMFSFLHVNAD